MSCPQLNSSFTSAPSALAVARSLLTPERVASTSSTGRTISRSTCWGWEFG